MKSIIKISALGVLLSLSTQIFAQNRNLDNYRQPDQRGINVFEDPKDSVSTFEELKVRLGGSSTLQYQALDHQNLPNPIAANGTNTLIEIGNNFNLATANLDLDVALHHGVRMHLRTYLSSRRHNETYVKGGYLQIDRLDFIKPGFGEKFMKYATIKLGHMENNYGDGHLRRTDNAQAIYNPFVGNYIMDAFTTEVGAELYLRNNGWLLMLGATNGKLNQGVTAPGQTSPSLLSKIGYDKQLNQDLRVRLTGSIYNTASSQRAYLYGGDRAGSRYYFVMEGVQTMGSGGAAPTTANGQFSSGLINPGLNNKLTAIMINPFIKYKGLEFFGMYEMANGRTYAEKDRRDWTQISADLIYRFGKTENFYVAGRYNTVSGKLLTGQDIDIKRTQIGLGWFMTKNILTKLEYVNQTYDGFSTADVKSEGKFHGFSAEAIVSF